MATTVNNIITKVDRHIGDNSTNSVTSTDRLEAISEAVQDLMENLGIDYTNKTYNFNYFDSINYYKVDSALTKLFETVELRREEGSNTIQFIKKPVNELSEEIANNFGESAFGVEYRNDNTFLVVNHNSKYDATVLHDCDTLDSNGTWTADTTNSDATNVTLDDNEFKQGTGSINFDVDVSQSASNLATIYNDDINSQDLTDDEDLSSLVYRVYIPDTTNFTSVTAYFGSSSSAYWSAASTTDLNGNAFTDGWNRIKLDWSDTSKTGSPDVTAVDYLRFDFNYTASQTDDTDFRIDDINMVRPEKLTLYYQSWEVGEDNASASLSEFTATTDVPFYSGQYDNLDKTVALKASSILFRDMGLFNESTLKENEYNNSLNKLKRKLPLTNPSETKSFKVKGINFRK